MESEYNAIDYALALLVLFNKLSPVLDINKVEFVLEKDKDNKLAQFGVKNSIQEIFEKDTGRTISFEQETQKVLKLIQIVVKTAPKDYRLNLTGPQYTFLLQLASPYGRYFRKSDELTKMLAAWYETSAILGMTLSDETWLHEYLKPNLKKLLD